MKAFDQHGAPVSNGDHQPLFVCTALNPSPKSDMGSMEHPIFALRAGDAGTRRYQHNGSVIEITSGPKGRATIHDQDILIYCTSHLTEALNRAEIPSRKIRATAYDLLKHTCRGTDGDAYRRLREALRRLAGTRIYTNIRSNGVRMEDDFGLIERWRCVRADRGDPESRSIALEITLSEWLYNAILGREVLTLSRDYFRLRKPIERRLYEVARKHCGRQPHWSVALDRLREKVGNGGPLYEFRRQIKAVARVNRLPEYRLSYHRSGDRVSFARRVQKGPDEAVEKR